MIAAIGPADYNYEETVSTLRFANRAKSIKNKPKINEDPKDAMLREFQDEIEKLKQMLGESGMDFDPSLPMDQQLSVSIVFGRNFVLFWYCVRFAFVLKRDCLPKKL